MEPQPAIIDVERIGGALLIYFSDGTASLYTARELAALHAIRERIGEERIGPANS